MGGSWWRGLTEYGPLEKGKADHFSIPALKTPMNSMKRQNDREIKSFTDKQKLREFNTTKPAMQQILKGLT